MRLALCQNPKGGVIFASKDADAIGTGSPPIFSAPLFTPLAALDWDDGKKASAPTSYQRAHL